jgi:Histidine ammonia-lyase
MSTHAARKLRSVIANVQAVIAIELMVAAQAVEWRIAFDFTPRNPAPRLSLAEADAQANEFASRVRGRASELAAHLGRGTRDLYLRVRQTIEPVFDDRPLSDDIRRLRSVVTVLSSAPPH